jgi:spore coat protein U-like protein
MLPLTTTQAQTATGTLNVTATVLDSCEINATADVAFGNLVPGGPATDVDAAGSISWACTAGSGVDMGIADGDRFLTGTATPIPYLLFQDAARTIPWGAQVIGSTATELDISGLGVGILTPIVQPVYGRILEASYDSAAPGNYTDDLLVTIEF